MNDNLSKLYQNIILKHNKNPLNFEKKEDAQYHVEAYNPLCGDHFHIYLNIEENKIQETHFHGYGCAICKASASVMVKNILDKDIQEAKKITEVFLKVAHNTLEEGLIVSEEFQAFAAARNFPSRIDCATLSWDRLLEFLNSIEHPS